LLVKTRKVEGCQCRANKGASTDFDEGEREGTGEHGRNLLTNIRNGEGFEIGHTYE